MNHAAAYLREIAASGARPNPGVLLDLALLVDMAEERTEGDPDLQGLLLWLESVVYRTKPPEWVADTVRRLHAVHGGKPARRGIGMRFDDVQAMSSRLRPFGARS